MIYCSLDPGLLILEGLPSHDVARAKLVINSLILHNRKMESCHAQIHMTGQFIRRVYASFDHIPISNPPILSTLRDLIIAILARVAQPILPPAGVMETILQPDITSDWITEEIKHLWFDSLSSTFIEKITSDEVVLGLLTWYRENLANSALISNPQACQLLDLENTTYEVPILSSELDWSNFICILKGWPNGIDSTLIEFFAKRELGIPTDKLVIRRKVEFDLPCLREIERENNPEFQKMIIEIIACRAYNCLRPNQHDEIIKPGIHRIYVKKMRPPARLHYQLGKDNVTFTLYSNGDHNRGLN